MNSDLLEECLQPSSTKKIMNINTNSNRESPAKVAHREHFLSYHASKEDLNMPSFGNLRQSDVEQEWQLTNRSGDENSPIKQNNEDLNRPQECIIDHVNMDISDDQSFNFTGSRSSQYQNANSNMYAGQSMPSSYRQKGDDILIQNENGKHVYSQCASGRRGKGGER